MTDKARTSNTILITTPRNDLAYLKSRNVPQLITHRTHEEAVLRYTAPIGFISGLHSYKTISEGFTDFPKRSSVFPDCPRYLFLWVVGVFCI